MRLKRSASVNPMILFEPIKATHNDKIILMSKNAIIR